MRQQATAPALVFTVNGQPLAAYLRQPEPAPIRRLAGEVDGHPVVWATDRYRRWCAHHGEVAGCGCVDQLAALADVDRLRTWRRGLTRQQARQVRAAAAAAYAATRSRPEREWPDWLTDLMARERLIPAVLLLALLLLLAPPLLDR